MRVPMKKIIFITLLLLSSNTFAQWFQASANAVIINKNIEEAREQAIKKAVKDALLFSGGTISSLQQVNQGVLVENQLILNSGGEIKALKIGFDSLFSDSSMDFAVCVDIESLDDLKKYANHKEHLKAASIVREKLIDRKVIDFEI